MDAGGRGSPVRQRSWTAVDVGGRVVGIYGSDGWGFESLRACRIPVTVGRADDIRPDPDVMVGQIKGSSRALVPATVPPTFRRPRRMGMVRPYPVAAALVLMLALAGACTSVDGDDAPADDTSTSTTKAEELTPSTDEEPATDGDGVGAVGWVTVDGEDRPLDRIVGITSCRLDGSGDLSITAKSDAETEDGGTYFSLRIYADDPSSDEVAVIVGDAEYVSASPDAIEYAVDGEVVSGTAAVEPLFEEGAAQEVAFEVDCGDF